MSSIHFENYRIFIPHGGCDEIWGLVICCMYKPCERFEANDKDRILPIEEIQLYTIPQRNFLYWIHYIFKLNRGSSIAPQLSFFV